MLILARKPLERILVGSNIVITIKSIRGNRVKVGIEAPKELRVLRERSGAGSN